MGLTAEIELALSDAKLIDFFDANRSAFKEIAISSYAFAYGYVHKTGLPLRPDDVAKALVAALVTNETLRECLGAKKLRQQHWYVRFADLIMSRLWEELTNEHTP